MTNSREVLGTCDNPYATDGSRPHSKMNSCVNWKPVAPPSAKVCGAVITLGLSRMYACNRLSGHPGMHRCTDSCGTTEWNTAVPIVETAGTANRNLPLDRCGGDGTYPVAAPTPEAGRAQMMEIAQMRDVPFGQSDAEKIAAPVAEMKLPPLPKPIRNSKHWDGGVEWAIAGERTVRLEREDQLLSALAQLREARAEIARLETLLREK